MDKNLKKILIIEDDPSILEFLVLVLSESYHPIMANNGHSAVDLIHAECRPDLIILDYLMPILDGEAFLKIKRAHEGVASVPVIVLTGSLQEFEDPDIVKTIRKPFDINFFLKAIQSILDD